MSAATEDRREGEERRSAPSGGGGDDQRAVADRRSGENIQLVTFYIDGQHFAVDVGLVQEIIPPQPMAPIPTAPSHFAGLINLRGQIVTAIDLRLLLGFEAKESIAEDMILVVNAPSGQVSLVFEQIGDVMDIASYMIEPPPGTLDENLRTYIRSVAKLDQHLLLMLDVEAVARA